MRKSTQHLHLSYNTILTLCHCSAIKILCDRFLSSHSNVTELTADLYSPDAAIRAQAAALLNLLDNGAASNADAIDFLVHLHESENTAPARHRQSFPYRPRNHDESFEEQALRRRRREAIVLNEGGPVSQDDIIQRNASGEQVARPRDEVESRRVEGLLRDVVAGARDGVDNGSA